MMLPDIQNLRAALMGVTTSDAAAWLLQMTAVAALGHAALWTLSRSTAATRHGVAVAALAATLVVSLVTPLLPRWQLPILPARAEALSWTASSPSRGAAGADRSDRERSTIGGDSWSRASVASAPGADAPSRRPPWTALALSAVMLVAVLRLVAWRMACVAARRIVAGARDVTDPLLLHELDRARRILDLWQPLALRISAEVTVPVVFGVLRPVLLLPSNASTWPIEQLRSVLLHEVAHVRRRDGVAQALMMVANAVLWFHPLAWTLTRVARRECERACDDAVLVAGVRASDYAEHLLDVARVAGRDRFAWAPSFARRSSVEDRLIFILESSVRRGPASRAVVAIAVVAAILAIPLTTARVVAARAAAPKHASSRVERSASVEADRPVLSTLGGSHTVAETPDETEPMTKTEAAMAAGAAEQPKIELASRRSDREAGEEWYDQAKELYDSEQYAAAGAAYVQAARLGYREDTAWYNAACSYSLAGQKDRALDAFDQALDSGFDSLHLLQSDTDLNSIRTSERFRARLKEALASEPAQSEHATALRQWERISTSRSDDPDRWGEIGIELLRSGEPERAAEAFAGQLRLEESSSARYNLACAQATAGQTTKAMQTLEQSILEGYGDGDKIEEDPDLASIRTQAGFSRLVRMAEDLSLFGNHNWGFDDRFTWRRNLDRYERVTEKYPGAGRAWFNLGYVRLRAGDASGSHEAYERSLELKHRPGTTMYNLACASAQMGRRDEAIDWLQRAEAAGMEVRNHAPSDSDLAPLRTDPRYRAMRDRWRQNVSAKYGKHAKDTYGKDKDWDDETDSDTEGESKGD